MSTPLQILDTNKNAKRVAVERQSQRIVSAFVITGLFFMLLPGTFLGVWNLVDISEAHLSSALRQAWLQAHGQAQIFGWIGSFILGIGLYSLTKTQSSMNFPARAAWAAWSLWTLGIALRWLARIVMWEWRIVLPFSGLLQLTSFLSFCYAIRRYGPKASASQPEAWMRTIAASTVGFLLNTCDQLWPVPPAGFRCCLTGSPACHRPGVCSSGSMGDCCSYHLGVQRALAAGICGT
ncbi:hypothetical protein P8936_09405 [Edaphobacter paludis]|uniref:Uncharacterized protein n=1 Tax=Edaphobacter paludis TaxID=3035702 RepID=A0AAU7CU57_9BACT